MKIFSLAFSLPLSLAKPKKPDKTHTPPHALPLRRKCRWDKPYGQLPNGHPTTLQPLCHDWTGL